MNELSDERIKRLDELGFVWNPKDAHWERMFAELLCFKDKAGDCAVPDRWPENPELATWVSTLRQQKRRGKLDELHIQRLSAEGFIWDARDDVWEAMFQALINYRNKTGSIAIPRDWPANPKLAGWSSRQRGLRKREKLSADRIRRLDAQGFPWLPHDVAWEEHFAKYLARRHSRNGLSNKWESHQRTGRKAGTLSAERMRRLTDAGFEWRIKKGPKGLRRVTTR